MVDQIVPGPPFVFGALLMILAFMVAAFIPENMGSDAKQHSNQNSIRTDNASSHYFSNSKIQVKKSDVEENFDDKENDASDNEFHVPLMDSAKGGFL